MTDFLPYARHHLSEEDVRAVVEVLRGGLLTQGPRVPAFEEALAETVGARFAVALSSGTAALHAAYAAAGLGPGRRLVTTPNTFAATANAAALLGAEVDFADIDLGTALVDPAELAKRLERPAAVVAPVHFAGQPCDGAAISALARRAGALVVEDAAHALGAEERDADTGEWSRIGACRHSDMTIFSFHPVKHLALGEGGAVTTNDPALARRVAAFRSHGVTKDPELLERPDEGPWWYEMQSLGCNYRITDLQCALGLSQLGRLGAQLARRRAIAERYAEAFAGHAALEPLGRREGARSAWHLFVVHLRSDRLRGGRRAVVEALHRRGIGAHVHYIPVHLHPWWRRERGFRAGDYPRAEAHYQRAVTLPLFPAMQDSDVERVICAVHDALAETTR